ncbi:hypothetical protein GC194_09990 [bacterium]|nr:hypothetical protein [bacterium]
MKTRKILLVNEGYSDNLGDQAIMQAARHYLSKENEVDFADFTRECKEPILCAPDKNNGQTRNWQLKKLLPHKLRWIAKHLPRLLKALRNNYDYVVIGGGQLILSNGHFPMAFFVWTILAKHFFNAKVMVLGVGVANQLKPIDKWLYKKSLSKCSKILVRDLASKKRMEALTHKTIAAAPDWAFLLPEKYPVQPIQNTNVLVGVTDLNVYARYREKISREMYYKKWVALLAPHLDNPKNIYLIYTTKADATESLQFQAYMQQNHQIQIPLLENESLPHFIENIGGAKTLVAGRMHALILGKIYAREIIAFPVSNKIQEFDSEVNKPENEAPVLSQNLQKTLESLFNESY